MPETELSPFAQQLLKMQQEHNDQIISALNKGFTSQTETFDNGLKLIQQMAPPRYFFPTILVSLLLGGMALVVFCVALVAQSRGIDPTNSASATHTVIQTIPAPTSSKETDPNG